MPDTSNDDTQLEIDVDLECNNLPLYQQKLWMILVLVLLLLILILQVVLMGKFSSSKAP